MFTGLIEDVGRVRTVKRVGKGCHLTIDTQLGSLESGESIAVNGACLTVAESRDKEFTAEMMPETISRTTLGGLYRGDPVNLERALRVGDRLGGHFVTGHVDAVGEVAALKPQGNALLMKVKCPPEIIQHSVVKGSIAIDGVSLTVARLQEDSLVVSLVTHTLEMTNLKNKKRGEAVNLESDLLGKYVHKYASRGVEQPRPEDSRLDADFLREHGFGGSTRNR